MTFGQFVNKAFVAIIQIVVLFVIACTICSVVLELFTMPNWFAIIGALFLLILGLYLLVWGGRIVYKTLQGFKINNK